jgi:hypothetical protein
MSNFRMCADCALLVDASATPHELLVVIDRCETPGTMKYRCLVCNTHHVLETFPPGRKARIAAPSPGARR